MGRVRGPAPGAHTRPRLPPARSSWPGCWDDRGGLPWAGWRTKNGWGGQPCGVARPVSEPLSAGAEQDAPRRPPRSRISEVRQRTADCAGRRVGDHQGCTGGSPESGQETAARLKDYEDDTRPFGFNFMNEPQLDVPVDQSDSFAARWTRAAHHRQYVDMQCRTATVPTSADRSEAGEVPQTNCELVVKHYPLDKKCNPQRDRHIASAACPTAVTLEAARAIGGEEAFWRMYDDSSPHQAISPSRPRNSSRPLASESASATTNCGRRSTPSPSGTA